MKKLFSIFAICLGILSWIFFLLLAILAFSPWNLIKNIDRYVLPAYSIDFSKLESSGNALNRNLKFYDLYIMHNDDLLIEAKELDLGLSFKPQKLFYFFAINNITIKDGYFDYSNTRSSNSSTSSIINFSDEILLSFENFKYQRNDSLFEINGNLFGDLSRSFYGQLSFLHNNKLSTIAVNALDDSYRFSLNLHSYEWLNFIPTFNTSLIKNLAFQINAIGEFEKNKSNLIGSFNSSSLLLQSLSIGPNRGSFHYQSKKNIGLLKLTEFLHPLIDEEYPIQINLQKQSLAVPRFYISPEILKIKSFNLSNLIIENFFLSFSSLMPKYSGFVKDLDLKDLYFKEINNLSGDFSGYGNQIKFLVDSTSSIIKNYNQNLISASISGAGNFSDSVFDLKARIKNQSTGINLALTINPELINPLSFQLKGHDVSKDLIKFSLPYFLKSASSYIDTSINLGRENSIYFNYSVPSNNLKADLKAKILMNESKLMLNENSKINFARPIIEADNQNLYFFSPFGKVMNFSYEEAYGLINYDTQKLSFYSLHDLKSIDLKSSFDSEEWGFNLPDIQAEHKGEIKLSTLKLNNAISLNTKTFYMPISQSNKIEFDKGSIFIVDLDSVFGSLPSRFMKEEMLISLIGIGLTKKYDLTFSTNINFEPSNLIKNSSFLEVSGNDLFKIDLNIQKNAIPVLKLNSDLKNIKLNSPLNSLSKNKLIKLPTEIFFTNFSNPSIRVINQKIDMHIRDLRKYEGYISIGKKLPDQYKNFLKETGLNLYLYSEFLDEKMLISMLPSNQEPTSIKFNKLAFDVKNFKLFNNKFSDLSGFVNFKNSGIMGNIIADELNLDLKMDQTGFVKIEIKDSTFPDVEFMNSSQSGSDTTINSRLIIKNSSFGKIKIKDLDMYLVNNKKKFSLNNMKLSSNLISIKPTQKSSTAFFSIDKIKPLYKIRGDFLIKDSKKIPYLGELADFSYFNGSINLQLEELSTLSHIEGDSDFILKDLVIKDSLSDSLAFNLLGVLNLRNILGKIANLDLSINDFTSIKLGRVEGDFIFNESKLRLASPLFIETNAAKMRWIGQINKNSKSELNDLDLNLDLRIRVEENLPWYAAILGGLPAIAGSAVLNEIFEEDINNLTNYQYEVLGTISEPKLERIKQEIK